MNKNAMEANEDCDIIIGDVAKFKKVIDEMPSPTRDVILSSSAVSTENLQIIEFDGAKCGVRFVDDDLKNLVKAFRSAKVYIESLSLRNPRLTGTAAAI